MKNSSGTEHRNTVTAAWQGLPRPVRAFILLDAALWMIALLTECVCRYAFHLGYPYRSFLLFEHFPDIIGLRARFTHLHTLAFFTDTVDPPCMYPAPVAAIYSFFFRFKPYDLAAYLLFGSVAFVIGAIVFFRALLRRGVNKSAAILLCVFACLTSYPLFFTLKQANLEICIWCLIAFGLFSFYHRRNTTAAVCFGIATAIKIFPFVYLALFLAQKRVREFFIAAAIAVAAAVAVTVPSLYLLYPHPLIAWKLDNIAISRFRPLVTLRNYPQRGFDHSIFGLIKSLLHPLPPIHQLSSILNYYFVTAALLAVVVYFLRIRCLPFINQVLALTIVSIWLPPTSFDYTLLHLYAPWVLLVFFAVQQRHVSDRALLGTFLCFAVLASPQTEVIFHGMSYGGQIKSLALGVLFVFSLLHRFESADDAALAPASLRTAGLPS